jgi:hypothetical protein
MFDATPLAALPAQFELLGPRWDSSDQGPSFNSLWRAKVAIVPENETRQARLVYEPANSPANATALTPGTMRVQLRILEVTLQIGDKSFQLRPPVRPVTGTFLINTNPAGWERASPFTIQRVLCVAGQFPLAPFLGNAGLPREFMRCFEGLLDADGAPPTAFQASSSGMLFEARPRMIVDEQPLSFPLPLILEVAIDPPTSKDAGDGREPTSDGALAVRIDPDRLELDAFSPGRKKLAEYFLSLHQRLNPTLPGAELRPRLHWVRLELADSRQIPLFHWRIPPAQPSATELRFASGEWRLFVADQSPLNAAATSPRGVLAATPDVTIRNTGVIAIPSRVSPNKQVTASGTATYMADLGKDLEEFNLEDVPFVYNPFRVASHLRSATGLPTPRADDLDSTPADGAGGEVQSDGKIDPPLLWGFSPLADGWVQLPFFNLTEDLLLDALPPPSESQTGDELSQFRGAVVLGTDRPELYDRRAGRPPWNLALLDAEHYEGHWTFSHDADRSLHSVQLTLSGLEATAEGLVMLAAAAPRAEDAIPTLDNWVNGLVDLPLKTLPSHSAAEPYPCPFVVNFHSLKLQRSLAESGERRATASITAATWSYEANRAKYKGVVRPGKLAAPGQSLVAEQDVEFPLHVWLTALPSSRFPLQRCWGTTVDDPLLGRGGVVWRRHPSHPCIQSLPLTDNTRTANQLSASRQLIPFHLPLTDREGSNEKLGYLAPHDWTFQLTDQGFAPYASPQQELKPLPELARHGRLVVVPLGLPGVALGFDEHAGPFVDKEKFCPRLGIRHDLPLLDQPHALADVPRDGDARADDSSNASSLNEVSRMQQAPPLGRTDFASHWAYLETKAVLAEVDEAAALVATSDGLAVRGLMEPRLWPVDRVETELASFPGSMSIADRLERSRVLRWEGETAETDALRGVAGRFEDDSQFLRLAGAGAPVQLTGGSFEAIVDNGRLRDQRGLLRGASSTTGPLVRTPLGLLSVTPNQEFSICSLRCATPLMVGATRWQFWCKGLPTRGSSPYQFHRVDTMASEGEASTTRRGNNDPLADGRDFGPLNGYEWRLSHQNDQPWLPLGDLLFFPLVLEEAAIDDAGKLLSARITGRLQLTAWDGQSGNSQRELPYIDSVVTLGFQDGMLRGLERASAEPDPLADSAAEMSGDQAPAPPTPPCRWPLQLSAADTGAAQLVWTKIELASDQTRIILPKETYRLEFVRQGLLWSLLGDHDLNIPLDGSAPVSARFTPPSNESDLAAVQSVNLILHPTSGQHQLRVDWVFRIGDRQHVCIEITTEDNLLAPSSENAPTACLRHGASQIALALTSPSIDLETGGVSIDWSSFDTEAQGKGEVFLQLLPGMALANNSGACRGLALLAFQQVAQPKASNSTSPQDPAPSTWWRFEATAAYTDIVFDCEWPTSSGARGTGASWDEVFRSSSGAIQAEYHMAFDRQEQGKERQGNRWTWELRLSGALEVANLISWPASLAISDAGQVRLPSIDDRPLDHWRHTATILLSEQRLSGVWGSEADLEHMLIASPNDNCLFTIGRHRVWNMTAPVEHRLVRWTAASGLETDVPATWDRELRWNCVQEVRLCDPRSFHAHLTRTLQAPLETALDPSLPADGNSWQTQRSRFALDGWQASVMLRELGLLEGDEQVVPFARSRLRELCSSTPDSTPGEADVLLVEATAPLFLRPVAGVSQRSGAPLLAIGGETLDAAVSTLSDFLHDSDDGIAAPWRFCTVPLLGRLQERTRDTADASSLFGIDPARGLATLAPASAPPRLWKALAHRGGKTEVTIQSSSFDLDEFRQFRRLDPASLAEAWNRLLRARYLDAANLSERLPPPVTLPADSDAIVELARPEALHRLFDPRRAALPPVDFPKKPLPSSPTDRLVWTPQAIAVLQNRFTPSLSFDLPYAFVSFPLAFAALVAGDNDKTRPHVAATLLPIPGGSDDWVTWRQQAVSLAVSPFTRVDRVAFESVGEPVRLLSTAEIVAFDVTRSRVSLLTSLLLHGKPNTSEEEENKRAQTLASQFIARQASDTPAAAIRVRTIVAVNGNRAIIKVLFRFLPVQRPPNVERLGRRAMALRPTYERIRWPQGQFGGTSLPASWTKPETNDSARTSLADFEIAPPLVRGVQPLRLDERPRSTSGAADAWPWGLAALRFSTAYRSDPLASGSRDVGSVGLPASQRLWWQSPEIRVQFGVPDDRQFLPPGYRAVALPGFLPTWNTIPLPNVSEIAKTLDVAPSSDNKVGLGDWAPVLPGKRRVIVTGLRPGAPYAYRDSLTTQDWNGSVSQGMESASIPVQHRAPRPVLLPASKIGGQEIALRPWGSWFDLQSDDFLDRTVHASESNTAEFARLTPSMAAGIRLTVAAPTLAQIEAATPDVQVRAQLKQAASLLPRHGEIRPGWDGSILLSAEQLGHRSSQDWKIRLVVTVEGNSFLYTQRPPTTSPLTLADIPGYLLLEPAVEVRSRLLRTIASLAPGRLVEIEVQVELPESAARPGEQTIRQAFQTSRWQLRTAGVPFDSSFSPRFLSWEDPEYNRRLASLAARREKMIVVNNNSLRFALVADRREYNPTGAIFYSLVGPRIDEGIDGARDIDDVVYSFFVVGADGVPRAIKTALHGKFNTIPTGENCDLATLAQGLKLEIGATFRIEAVVFSRRQPREKLVELQLDLNIVQQRVTPAPEAAYAVIRRTEGVDESPRVDECVRFAWGPEPTRVELIDANDLNRQVVRRRAVFETIDVIRGDLAERVAYTVQKTTSGGSTHFPQAAGRKRTTSRPT